MKVKSAGYIDLWNMQSGEFDVILDIKDDENDVIHVFTHQWTHNETKSSLCLLLMQTDASTWESSVNQWGMLWLNLSSYVCLLMSCDFEAVL